MDVDEVGYNKPEGTEGCLSCAMNPRKDTLRETI